MKRVIKIFSSFIILLFLAACGQSSDNANDNVYKIGVVGGDHEVWDFVVDKLKADDIHLEIVEFSDYNQPNDALAAKDIDLNSFQHIDFLNKYNEQTDNDLVSIGETNLAPIGIYSHEITTIDEIEEGAMVPIPDDVSNQSRAITLLETAGLIKTKQNADEPLEPSNIVENNLNLEIVPMNSNQTARSLDDAQIAVINNGMAIDAGLNPLEDAIFLEPVDEHSQPFINIIAVRKEDKNNEVFKRIVAAYQADDTKELIIKKSKGSSIPAWDE